MRIAVTGTPGVGKTMVAAHVSDTLKIEHIDVSQTASKMGAVIKKEEGSLVVDTDILRENLQKMDNIIIDSHFAEVFDVDFVFVLRCEPKILYERLRKRGYSEKKIKENVLAEMLDYCLQNALQHHAPEKVFEIHDNAVKEILSIVENPSEERSLAHGSATHFLTEENLKLVE
jgi:adenylate kinase